MGVALLFWGWENGSMLWASLLAATLEGARLTRTRWELSNTDLYRISDLCWVLLVTAAVLVYSADERLVFVFKLAQQLPLCFFPLMLAQAYGNRPAMPLSVFWWLLRRWPSNQNAHKSYNVSYCYFALCLLAASASTRPKDFFYVTVSLLVAWALCSARPRRVSLAAWMVFLTLAIGAGQLSHKELRQIQNAVESALGAWVADFFRPSLDTKECQTRIGSSGQIPQSGKIALRLQLEPGGFAPALLREETWDAYNKQIWSASNNDFSPVPSRSLDTVKLFATNALSTEVEIARYYEAGEGTLPLPQGTFEIDDLPAVVKTNRLGVTKIESGPGLVDMRVTFGPGRSIDSLPCDRDITVPSAEKPVLADVVAKLKLDGIPEPQKKIRAIERFFRDPANHFRYTLNLPRRRERVNQPTALGYFLTNSFAGHCEYFATATVLLLRQAGIPARYVTGYLVPESERHGNTYLVRARDAHAWALAYRSDTGLWEQVDNTPSDRAGSAGVARPWWEPASDAFSNLYFQFSKWRWSKASFARYANWLLGPVILYLIGRIIFTQRRQRVGQGAAAAASVPPWPGLDSELFLINRQLAAMQLSRMPNEPLHSWQQRLELAYPASDRLRRIFHLHRSLRFDPLGLKNNEREMLRDEALVWLAELAARAKEKQAVTTTQ
jgi:transglutaminase-like putative cysteine protease